MNAIEMAIRLEVSAGDIEVRLVALPQPWCGPALERQIELLTPELIAYYRMRGAASAVSSISAAARSRGWRAKRRSSCSS